MKTLHKVFALPPIRDGVVAVHPCGHLFHYVPNKIWRKIAKEEATALVLQGASALRQHEECRDCWNDRAWRTRR